MKDKTRQLWNKQNQHPGDRLRLFRAVGSAFPVETALYPGSYVDIAPSFVFSHVTYTDTDKRAASFFSDSDGVREIIGKQQGAPNNPDFKFLHANYSEKLGLPDQSFDLLVSLYAGFISESCTRYLRVGGTLLVNSSHGDAAMASIDLRYRHSGVVISNSGDYRVKTRDLDSYLIPKKPTEVTKNLLHALGRGIGYTKSPFACLFERMN